MSTFQSRWWQLAAIQIGGAICLPIFVLGHAMAEKYGLASALLSVILGNWILLGLSLIAARYSAKTRMTTSEAAADTFGQKGKVFFAIIIIVSMMGWFSVQLDLMGTMAARIFGIEAYKPINLILGAVITLAGLKGIRSLEWLAKVCMPLLILTIAYAIVNASGYPSKMQQDDTLTYQGICIIIAAALGIVVDMPTFFRHAKSTKDALIAAACLFGIALPLLESVGIYLAKQGAGSNIADALIDTHSSALWKLWVAIFIILAGWTTNNTNLYSAAASLKSALNLSSERGCYVIIGTAATLLSLIAGESNLTDFLEIAGIMLASAGGVMIFHQLRQTSTHARCNAVALLTAVSAGILELVEWIHLSGYGMIDAFGISFLISACGSFWMIFKHNNKEKQIYEIC